MTDGLPPAVEIALLQLKVNNMSVLMDQAADTIIMQRDALAATSAHIDYDHKVIDILDRAKTYFINELAEKTGKSVEEVSDEAQRAVMLGFEIDQVLDDPELFAKLNEGHNGNEN